MTEKPNVATMGGDEKRVEYSEGLKHGEEFSSEEGSPHLRTVENGADVNEIAIDYSPEETKRILRKIDYRLVPLLGVLYLLAFIDRGNSTCFFFLSIFASFPIPISLFVSTTIHGNFLTYFQSVMPRSLACTKISISMAYNTTRRLPCSLFPMASSRCQAISFSS